MTSMQVLLIDDDLHTRSVLSRYLEKEGFHVLKDSDETSALNRMLQNQTDLVVLDIDLSELNGLELCAKIRHENHTPVLILTSRHDEKDVISSFEAGPDDVVVKPFSPREVVHRISAIIRRTSVQVSPKASSSRLCLDPKARKVTVNGIEIELTLKEYDLLYYLVNHTGRSFSRENLITEVWHYAYQGDCRTVYTHIKRLRKKMNVAAPGSGQLIQTIRGVGYRMSSWLGPSG
ncbi:DNA-binding response regulator [Paenibacillus cisolokensis]|uniref:DNA-binding response regulator n=2 Tax=Paenibacillus cisolokensis TaxID=1658519 RepID=A0ABQ4NDM8_9BACL|nr:DNA-binding response regulator [Paenibacillus cisolokensis]